MHCVSSLWPYLVGPFCLGWALNELKHFLAAWLRPSRGIAG